MKEKIGIIGCGNMGGALIEGISASGLFEDENILIYDSATRFITKNCNA